MNEHYIKGRPIDIYKEKAPSFKNRLLRIAAGEYMVGDIVPVIKYLLSEDPIDAKYWYRANYSDLNFTYNGERIRTITNHGMESCMNAVMQERLDICDWVLDLCCLLGIAMKDREERDQFKKEVQEKTQYGIEREVINIQYISCPFRLY